MKNFPYLRSILFIPVFILLGGLTMSPAQNTTRSIGEDQAMAVDTLVSQNSGLDPVEYHKTHTFITVSGIEYNIFLAVASSSEGSVGGQFSAYAWQHELTGDQEAVLTDSLPNTCISIVNLDDFDTPDAYQDFAENHWLNCGYVDTEIDLITQTTLKVYPNPARNGFHIEAGKPFKTLIITNQSGQTVYEKTAPDAINQSMYVQPALAPGLYIIRVTDPQGVSASAKILIR